MQIAYNIIALICLGALTGWNVLLRAQIEYLEDEVLSQHNRILNLEPSGE
jgi:hypothetical protein